MIKLGSNFNVIEHSEYPAMISEPSYGNSLYTRDISCLGFTERTGVGIQDEEGYPADQDFIELYVQHIRADTFRVATLPDGYTISFQQHPEGIQEMILIDEDDINREGIKGETGGLGIEALNVSEFNRALDEQMEEEHEDFMRGFNEELTDMKERIEEETQDKVQNLLQELSLKEPEPVSMNYTYLEAFDLLLKRSREWWFDLTTEEAYKAKVGIMMSSNSLVDTEDIVRMYINTGEYNGIREPVNQLPFSTAVEAELDVYDEMNKWDNIRDQFLAMFKYRMLHAENSEREALTKKIILWAQGL